MSVDEIESMLLLESQVDVQTERRVGFVAEIDRAKSPGHRRDVSPRRPRIAAREGRDLVATPIELANELVDDPLRAPVADRRDGLQRRSDLGDPQPLAGLTP